MRVKAHRRVMHVRHVSMMDKAHRRQVVQDAQFSRLTSSTIEPTNFKKSCSRISNEHDQTSLNLTYAFDVII